MTNQIQIRILDKPFLFDAKQCGDIERRFDLVVTSPLHLADCFGD